MPWVCCSAALANAPAKSSADVTGSDSTVSPRLFTAFSVSLNSVALSGISAFKMMAAFWRLAIDP